MPRRQAPPALLLPALAAAAVSLVPLAYLVIRAGEAGPAGALAALLRLRTVELVIRSLVMAGLVTVLATVVGVSLAALVTRTSMPGRRLVAVLAALPLAIPSYVAAFAWISAAPTLEGLPGAVLVLTACTYPYVYLPAVAALRGADPAGEEVARSLGRSQAAAFVTVTLGQIRAAVGSGALLVALYALSDFGAVSIMRYDVFTRVIYTSYRASFDRTPAAVLSLLLVVITVAVVIAEHRARGRSERARVTSTQTRRASRWDLGRWRVPALMWCAAVLLPALVVPVLSVAYWSFTGLSAGVHWGRLSTGVGWTLWLSVLGGVSCLLLAVPVGILAARFRTRTAAAIEQVTWFGHALPGIVVALSLVFLGIRAFPGLYQRVPLVVFSYAVLALPAAVGSVRANVAMSTPAAEEVARSLGLRSMQVIRRVTVPLAAPGIAAGFALVVLSSMKELPATLLLRPTGVETLATSLWTHTSVTAYAAAAPYALTLVVVAVLPTLWLLQTYRNEAQVSHD